MSGKILQGDCRDVLRTLPDASVHCCVTSPPYYGLRDYGVAGQIGLEATPAEYIAEMVGIFREVRRVLRDDGTVWLNLGDSYATGAGKVGAHPGGGVQGAAWAGPATQPNRMPMEGFKPKDLMMMPARLALALQADGWWLRSDIIWAKPNPMPESVTDRPTSAHEHIFLLAKAERYFFDAEAVREQRIQDEDARGFRGGSYVAGQPGPRAVVGNKRIKVPGGWDRGEGAHGTIHRTGRTEAEYEESVVAPGRNIRNVWTIATAPFPEAHFATFPPELAERCVKAGCPTGGTVLDPFAGAGTTLLVADRLQRDAIGIELNHEYCEMARKRISRDAPLFGAVA